MKKKEIIIIAVFLIVVGIMAFAYKIYSDSLNKETVQVVYKNKVLFEFDPNIDKVYKFDGSYGHMELEVKDGSWRITNEECPNHICSSVGWVNEQSYFPIICIPNEVYVSVKEQ